jgi:hypothetical protein
MAGVTAYWMVMFVVVMHTMPAPARAARTSGHAFVPGDLVTVYAPPLKAWPIPTDRATFDAYRSAVAADDEGALTQLVGRSGWLPVSDRERVRIVAVDGSVVQVEVLDGPHAGGRGWLLAQQLSP